MKPTPPPKKKQLTLSLPEHLVEQLEKESSELALSKSEFVSFLYEFYSLQHIHKIISQLSKTSSVGFDHVQRVQLSALYTYLSFLNQQHGIR